MNTGFPVAEYSAGLSFWTHESRSWSKVGLSVTAASLTHRKEVRSVSTTVPLKLFFSS
jgi:hypothetical protein